MDIKTVLGSAVASAAVVAVTVPAMVAFVGRQATTPGIAESGHSNITGNSIAGRFGAGTTPTTARVQINEIGGLIGMRSVTSTNDAINALTSATTGSTITSRFINSSASGKAVLAENISTTGTAFGGDFKARSTTGGIALLGRHIATSGSGIGISGETASGAGTAIVATNSAGSTRVELAGPKGAVYVGTGTVSRDYGAGPRGALPIAYGSVKFNGAIFHPGSGNWTSVRSATGIYKITITGENYVYGPYVSFINKFGGGETSTNSNSGKLLVFPLDSGGLVSVDSDFQFVVFKTVSTAQYPQAPEHGFKGDMEWSQARPKEYKKFRDQCLEAERIALAGTTEQILPPQ